MYRSMLSVRHPYAGLPSPWGARWSVSDESYTIHQPALGLSASDITLEINNNVLVLRPRASQSEEPLSVWAWRQGSAWRLPKDANVEGVTAELSRGVLTITIARILPAPARVISIVEKEDSSPSAAAEPTTS